LGRKLYLVAPARGIVMDDDGHVAAARDAALGRRRA
jgi:hypothetical protein